MAVTTEKSEDATAVRPLEGEIPQADLDDLRARILATCFAEKESVDDLSQGPRLATMQLFGGDNDRRKRLACP